MSRLPSEPSETSSGRSRRATIGRSRPRLRRTRSRAASVQLLPTTRRLRTMTFVRAPMPTCPWIVACPPHAPLQRLVRRDVEAARDRARQLDDRHRRVAERARSALAVVTTIGVALPPPVVAPALRREAGDRVGQAGELPPPPMQMPFVHVCPDAHRLPHAPQFALSLIVLMHVAAVPVPHDVCPAVPHTQAPLLQSEPPLHTRPHIRSWRCWSSGWRTHHPYTASGRRRTCPAGAAPPVPPRPAAPPVPAVPPVPPRPAVPPPAPPAPPLRRFRPDRPFLPHRRAPRRRRPSRLFHLGLPFRHPSAAAPAADRAATGRAGAARRAAGAGAAGPASCPPSRRRPALPAVPLPRGHPRLPPPPPGASPTSPRRRPILAFGGAPKRTDDKSNTKDRESTGGHPHLVSRAPNFGSRKMHCSRREQATRRAAIRNRGMARIAPRATTPTQTSIAGLRPTIAPTETRTLCTELIRWEGGCAPVRGHVRQRCDGRRSPAAQRRRCDRAALASPGNRRRRDAQRDPRRVRAGPRPGPRTQIDRLPVRV